MEDSTTLDSVIDVIVTALSIEERRASFDPATPLFGSLPELDSLGVLELVTALENRFDFEVDDSEFSGEIFESVGSLAEFVEQKRS
jgi:acyl carrier protein